MGGKTMKKLAESLRDEAIKRKMDFTDIRIVESDHTSISVQDGKADKVVYGKALGVGIRVLLDGVWGFAASSGVERAAAMECLESAISMAKASRAKVGERVEIYETDPVIDRVEAEYEKDPRAVPVDRKMQILLDIEKAAMDYGKDKIVNTTLGYNDSVRTEVICNTFGTSIESQYVRTSVGCGITAGTGSVRQRASEGRAKLAGFELIEEIEPKEFSVKAAETAILLLSAKRAPSGKLPVIFHPRTASLLIHEALGHNAEADHVISGESILEGRLGQKIAADCVTVVDDGTIKGAWGSYKYDSEGTSAQRRVIIENGILKGYMHSLETAAKFDIPPNGSARAQDYSFRPIVRMSNTFVVPGDSSFEELIKGIDLGIFVKGGRWGYVFCEKGQYTCHVGEGWIIRNGELAEHVRDVSMSGMILETLMDVDGVSQEFEMDKGGGTCGKGGQSMSVSGGGPYIRVKEMVIGGQENLM
jgi:TldD protein